MCKVLDLEARYHKVEAPAAATLTATLTWAAVAVVKSGAMGS